MKTLRAKRNAAFILGAAVLVAMSMTAPGHSQDARNEILESRLTAQLAAQRKLVKNFEGESLPLPPQQNADWVSPQDDIVAQATAAVFASGMADPRGLEYRAISIVTDISSFGRPLTGFTATHGWVLPPQPGQETRFAVAWNGLVYPVLEIGEAASLQDDVAKILNPPKLVERRASAFEESAAVAFDTLTSLKVVLLERLGEADAARAIWRALGETNKSASETASRWKADWVWALFARALGAHARDDDRLALLDLRALAPLEEEQRHNNDPPGRAGSLQEVSGLLEDQERRAKERANPENVNDEVARLIHDLENLHTSPMARLGGVSFYRESNVRKLIKLGDRAVPALLDALENDTRFTRSFQFYGNFPTRRVVRVAEAELYALQAIFRSTGSNLGTSNDLLTDAGRRAVIQKLRANWATYGKFAGFERPYQILRDDDAAPELWLDAARQIARPKSEGAYGPRSINPRGDQTPNGEELRARQTPSVSELMRRRATQLTQIALADPRAQDAAKSMHNANDLALTLGQWDASAAPFLGAQLQRWKKFVNASTDGQQEIYAAWDVPLKFWRSRIRSTSVADRRAANSDYAAWLAKQPLGAVNERFFQPMWTQSDDPVFRAAAKAMFGSPQASWGRLIRKPMDSSSRPMDLLDTPMMNVAAFRAMVARELQNTARGGVYLVDAQGVADISVDAGWQTGARIPAAERAIYPLGQSGEFRVCDLVGFYLRAIGPDKERHPRVQVYWPLTKRDRALKQTLAELRAGTLEIGKSEFPDY